MSEKEFIEKWGVMATKTQSAIERVVLKKILNDFAKVVNHLDHQNKELIKENKLLKYELKGKYENAWKSLNKQ